MSLKWIQSFCSTSKFQCTELFNKEYLHVVGTWAFFLYWMKKGAVVHEIAELIYNKKYEIRKWEEDPCEPCSLLQIDL